MATSTNVEVISKSPSIIEVSNNNSTTVVVSSNERSVTWNNILNKAEADPIFELSPAKNLSDGDLTNLRNQSGTNTGDQDLSSFVVKTTTINGHQLNQNVNITVSDLGLENVNNTSDVNKPISSATQTALNLKAPLDNPALTGVPTAPTAVAGTNSTQIATAAFVKKAIDDLVAGAPGALDTLKEISDQLANDESAVSALTTVVSSKVPQTRTVAGHELSADISISKSDVELGNVDNTSDSDKPVSTAMQAVLNGKASNTTTISAGSGLSGGGDLSANRSLSIDFANANIWSGAQTFLVVPTLSSLLSGSITFIDTNKNLTQDNSNLFWDNTNKRLGIGTASPTSALQIQINSTTTTGQIIRGYTGQTANLQEWQDSTGAVLSKIASDGALTVASLSVADNIVVNGTATRLPNQLASTVDAVMTRNLSRSDILNFDYIALRDEFMSGSATSGNIGALGWTLTADSGGDVPGYGSPGITLGRPLNNSLTMRAQNPGVRTAITLALADPYAGIAGFRQGFYPVGTTLKCRLAITNINTSVHFGTATIGLNKSPLTDGIRRGIRYIPPSATWTSGTYALGREITPTVSNGLRYRCTTAGTTASTEPAWTTTGTVSDGTIVWTVAGPRGSENWVGFTETASTSDDITATTVDLGVPVLASTGYDLAIKINSAGHFEFYINDVLCNSLPNSHNWSWTPFFQLRNDSTSNCLLLLDVFALYAPSH